MGRGHRCKLSYTRYHRCSENTVPLTMTLLSHKLLGNTIPPSSPTFLQLNQSSALSIWKMRTSWKPVCKSKQIFFLQISRLGCYSPVSRSAPFTLFLATSHQYFMPVALLIFFYKDCWKTPLEVPALCNSHSSSMLLAWHLGKKNTNSNFQLQIIVKFQHCTCQQPLLSTVLSLMV